ncbi:glycosyltransferase family 2 protein [Companilactobacillus nuruki]|uniref:Glycosyl transferase family 2 n=1 Tax=Companilactobacillus nuruki TaxID=1993540 RepID=A0A2N7AT11_9LACO|nr:glycosyltransferase family 2 protein [Companilactobacillus nuruki]PMD68825.1 glycosyl transferase family 2 [Companilactobacillus nuruki]
MNNKKPLISVIIPAYNVESTIEDCVNSVIKQDYKNKEIIIIDDKSKDKTLKIAKKLAQNVPYIRIYSIDHSGLSKVRNYGIEMSNGDYITFIDSDDTVESDYLSYLVYLIMKFNVNISSCQHKVVYSNNIVDNKLNKNSRIWNSHDWIEGILARDKVDLSVWGKLYKKELFKNILYPEGKVFEDTFTTYKVVLKSGGVAVGSLSKYNYIIRDNSITTESFNKKKLDLLEATYEMVNEVLKIYPDLYNVSRLRICWASVSVINSILFSKRLKDYVYLIKDLKRSVLKNRNIVLSNLNKDFRLKIAAIFLSMGIPTYSALLKFYFRK